MDPARARTWLAAQRAGGAVGRSLPGGDMTPNEELIRAVWGWDGTVGCAQAYIPAERPVTGPTAYAKLLPWKQHCDLMRAIVAAGVPDITYGVIVGLPDDSHDTLGRLLDAILELKGMLRGVNPALTFRVTPYAIRPLPGTPQSAALYRQGLIRFDDPAILGGFWTACADTKHLCYSEVADWQAKLMAEVNEPEVGWQGITALS